MKRRGNEPAEVFLNGAVSKLPDFMDALSEGLEIQGAKLNLFNAEVADDESEQIALFNNAFALAWAEMQGNEAASVNFIGEKQLREGRANKTRQAVVATSLIACFIIVFGGVDLYVKTRLAEKRVKQVKARIVREFKRISPKTRRIVNPYQQLTVQVDKLKKKNSLLKKLLNRRSSGLGILRDLSELIPPDVKVQLNDFLVDREDIQIGGETPFFEQIETLQKLISDSPKFTDVEVLESSSSQKNKQVRFKIRMKIVESE